MIYLKRVLYEDKYICRNEAHGLLDYALAEEYGFKPGYVIGHSPSGKPFLENYPQLHFNLSHCDGMVACAVEDGENCELGVDIEKLRPLHPKALARAFSAKEQEFVNESCGKDFDFFRLWTLKESFVKALGTGLAFGLKNAEFDFCGRDICSKQEGYSFKQYIIDIENDVYLLSVCNRGASSPKIKTESIHVGEQIYTIK